MKNEIALLIDLMDKRNISAYIIPTSDYHGSEYISDYFKERKFMSGFTGSAGTLLIAEGKAYLYTDGRYFIQAEKELADTGIKLMKMGLDTTPTMESVLKKSLIKGSTIAFDGKMIATSDSLRLMEDLKEMDFMTNINLIDEIWTSRPKLPVEKLYNLDIMYSGKEFSDKLSQIRGVLKKEHATMHIITSLEDQAWLYNMRGNDVMYTPVFLSYTIVDMKNTYLFIDDKKLKNVRDYLETNHIIIKPYESLYSFLQDINHETILLDTHKTNYAIYSILKPNNKIITKDNPTLLLKATKNDTEINNTKEAHIHDSVAVIKFMKYLKDNVATRKLTEYSVSERLLKFRQEQDLFIEPSFGTIAAYNDNAAMMHYSPSKEGSATLYPSGFLLVDSGGHYFTGTTDITRTFALGPISPEMKLHFTTVLKSVIALSSVTFMAGCTGLNLDILARGPIWDLGIDYKCGTGHGVGHILSVHEGPNGFRYKVVPERHDNAILTPGMITTNEPGIYLEGKYGIRTENEMLCVKGKTTEFGSFLKFETLTYVPIDLDAIDVSLLNQKEKDFLNSYHKACYNKTAKYLDQETLEWLKQYTREI